jgi:hypothetical protein
MVPVRYICTYTGTMKSDAITSQAVVSVSAERNRSLINIHSRAQSITMNAQQVWRPIIQASSPRRASSFGLCDCPGVFIIFARAPIIRSLEIWAIPPPPVCPIALGSGCCWCVISESKTKIKFRVHGRVGFLPCPHHPSHFSGLKPLWR